MGEQKDRAELREKILAIELCKTMVDCPTDYDDPCAECRADQILALIEEAKREERERMIQVLENASYALDEKTWQALKGD